ncbi:dihydrodipicolinate synthase family protein [Salinirubellus sp. GCM10025818]|uniref:dihydrodipicolinate synthase family protein n=1 Tax=Salinirubellus TaxID=2162630 RepID=UPI0030CB4F32
MSLTGVIPPMVTPTTGRSGTVDVDALRTFTEFLVDGGVHGLFPCGSIGEFSSLTREQRATVVETVVDAAGDRPVIAGCGGTAVGDVVEYVEDAEAAGADAAVVVTPYYLKTSDVGMVEFYEIVAAETSLPIVLYNIPPLTKHSLDVETVVELADRDEFIGIKDSSGDIDYINALARAVPDDFAVLPGVSALQVAALDGGADGAVNGSANFLPSLVTEIHDAYRAGDRERAVRLLNDVVNPITDAFSDVPIAAAIKHLVRKRGYDVGPPLPPLPTLSDEDRERLDRRYEEALEASVVG